MATAFDLSGVGKQGGDYKQNALQAAIDKDDITASVVDEIVTYGTASGTERKAWLCFCSGVEHARHMRDEIRNRGFSCETVTGDTPTGERDRILADFKSGKIRALTNNSVLTTGTNLPIIDLVAFCRPTLSAGLYVQMAGRGLRLYPGKENCLFLDFAGVVRKHGPIDAVAPPGMKSGSGGAPVKQCPQDEGGCGSLIHASLHTCPDCGYEFPVDETPKISAQAEDVPMLSKDNASTRQVERRTFAYDEGKGGKQDSVKVSYWVGMSPINEWLGPAHTGFFKSKSDRWWRKHGGQAPFPKTVLEFMERQNELLPTGEIVVKPNGKYWEVVDAIAGAANDNSPEAGNDNEPASNYGRVSAGVAEMLDDEIPF